MNYQKGSVALWLIVILIVIAVASATYWYLTPKQTQSTAVSIPELPTQQSVNTSDESRATFAAQVSAQENQAAQAQPSMIPYTDARNTFSLAYPASISRGANDSQSVFALNAPVSNLADEESAVLYVYVGKYGDVGQCDTGAMNPSIAVSSVVMNGISYKTFSFTAPIQKTQDSTEITTYETVHNGNCYNLSEEITAMNGDLSNYAATVKPIFSKVINSFTFTDNSPLPNARPVRTFAESATLNAGSLSSNSESPTIMGSARNVAQVFININLGTGTNQGITVYTSNLNAVVNGHWSIAVSKSLDPGTYTVHVYDPNGAPDLTSGVLTIR